MIQFIKKNYNMCPSKIYKENDIFYFYSNDEKVYIVKIKKNKKELDDVVQSSNILSTDNNISTFLLNINGEYYTSKDDYYIALLKYNDYSGESVTIDSIFKYVNYNAMSLPINKIDIVKEWEETIDTLEEELSEYNKEFPIVQESINYFIGISENAIQMLKSIKYEENSIGHNIAIDNFNNYEINNPLNLIKSNKMHDLSLYFKYNFYNNFVDYDELYMVLRNNTKEDLIYLFCSMMYQKEYFDEVKKILLNKSDEKRLYKYINRINDYKKLLLYIKNSLHNLSEIEEIKWIEN